MLWRQKLSTSTECRKQINRLDRYKRDDLRITNEYFPAWITCVHIYSVFSESPNIYYIQLHTRALFIHMVFYFKDVLEVGCCVCFYQRTKRLKASRSMDVKSIYLYIRIRKENVYVKCSKSICTFDVF